MKIESQQAIKEALAERGELPLTWECGCDSSLLKFAGWSDNWAHLSTTLQTAVRDLSEHIIDKLNLPGAGPVMDEGEGRVFVDASDGSVRINYSSRFMNYEIHETDLAEVLRKKDDIPISIEQLEAADFKFNIYIDIDEGHAEKDLLSNLSATPDPGESAKALLANTLKDYLPDFETQYWLTHKKSNEDYVKCRLIDVYGNWSLAEKNLVFSAWCGVEYLIHDLKEQVVVLF